MICFLFPLLDNSPPDLQNANESDLFIINTEAANNNQGDQRGATSEKDKF